MGYNLTTNWKSGHLQLYWRWLLTKERYFSVYLKEQLNRKLKKWLLSYKSGNSRKVNCILLSLSINRKHILPHETYIFNFEFIPRMIRILVMQHQSPNHCPLMSPKHLRLWFRNLKECNRTCHNNHHHFLTKVTYRYLSLMCVNSQILSWLSLQLDHDYWYSKVKIVKSNKCMN